MNHNHRNYSIEEIENFWNSNPLFAGEGNHSPGSKEWFQEHETVYINDCFAGNAPDPIFTRNVAQDARIIDIGCGPGFWVRYFLRHHYPNVSACDLTENAVELTRKSLHMFHLKESLDIRIANAEELPYDSGYFNHINCQGVIHHTPHPPKCLREFHRILVDKGTLCFSVYHKNFLLRHPLLLRIFCTLFSKRIGLKGRGRSDFLSSGDAHEIVRMYDGDKNPLGVAFTRKELKLLLQGLFEIEEVGYFYFPSRALPFPIPRTLHSWLHRNFGLMIVIRASKV